MNLGLENLLSTFSNKKIRGWTSVSPGNGDLLVDPLFFKETQSCVEATNSIPLWFDQKVE